MNIEDVEVIDCHIHPYLSAETNMAWFAANLSPDDYVAKLKDSGISRACGSVVKRLATTNFEDVKSLNREALEFKNQFPDFYIPAIHIHPGFPKESCEELESMHRAGVRWIGELVAYIMGYDKYLTRDAYPIYELARDLRFVVNLHPNNLSEIEGICQRFPELRIVMAHPTSSKGTINERIEMVAKHPNLFLDISGGGIQRWGLMRHAIDIAGKEKFLFGTDFPIGNPAVFVQGVLFENLSDDELEAVFSKNFKRLTGMG